MPLYRRTPKRGFTPYRRKKWSIVNLADFARITGTDVNPDTLFESGLIRSVNGPVKILGEGEVDRAVTVNAHAFSETAREKIEAAGGTAQVIE
jgi:large subunit ribosomal protein L15